MSDIRTYLKELREAKGLTMKETGKNLGISESYYSMIESGSRQQVLRVDMLLKLSETLECSVDELLCNEAG